MLTMKRYTGLILDGHGHDPDEVLAEARVWLARNTDLTPIGVRYLVPITALPTEAWLNSAGDFVQEHHRDAKPVTVVNLPEPLTLEAQ